MKEIRTAEIRAQAPAADGTESLIIEGTAIVFDTPTLITDRSGSYTEVIKRGALDGCDMTDSRLLYNHDLSRVPLARTPKTMAFTVTEHGLQFRATLPDTSEARSVYESIKRQDITGCSFGFTVPNDGSSYDPKTNTRTISKIDKLYEISVTPYPAYPSTSVEARSALQASKEHYRSIQNLKILCNTILRKEV